MCTMCGYPNFPNSSLFTDRTTFEFKGDSSIWRQLAVLGYTAKWSNISLGSTARVSLCKVLLCCKAGLMLIATLFQLSLSWAHQPPEKPIHSSQALLFYFQGPQIPSCCCPFRSVHLSTDPQSTRVYQCPPLYKAAPKKLP